MKLWHVVAALAVLSACRIDFEPLRDGAVSGVDTAAGDASVDICASALVCDSYDSGLGAAASTFGDAVWIADAGRGGGGGARTRATAAQSAIVHYGWSSPVTSGVLHARAYVNVSGGAPIQSYGVLVQLDNDVETNGLEKVSADLFTDDYWAIAAPFTGASAISPIVATRATWVCLELAIDISPTSGFVRLLADGVEVSRTGPTNTVVPSGFLQVTVGLSLGTGDPNTEASYDDVVVAQQPIGC